MSQFINNIFNKMTGRQKLPIEQSTADWIAVFQSCDDYAEIEERWNIYKREGFTYEQMQKVGVAYCRQLANIVSRMTRNGEQIPGVREHSPDEYAMRVDRAWNELQSGKRATGRYR